MCIDVVKSWGCIFSLFATWNSLIMASTTYSREACARHISCPIGEVEKAGKSSCRCNLSYAWSHSKHFVWIATIQWRISNVVGKTALSHTHALFLLYFCLHLPWWVRLWIVISDYSPFNSMYCSLTLKREKKSKAFKGTIHLCLTWVYKKINPIFLAICPLSLTSHLHLIRKIMGASGWVWYMSNFVGLFTIEGIDQRPSIHHKCHDQCRTCYLKETVELLSWGLLEWICCFNIGFCLNELRLINKRRFVILLKWRVKPGAVDSPEARTDLNLLSKSQTGS